MTTVAWDGTILAVDSIFTCQNNVAKNSKKIFKRIFDHDNQTIVALAFSGVETKMHVAKEWFLTSYDITKKIGPDNFPEFVDNSDDFEMIMVQRKNTKDIRQHLFTGRNYASDVHAFSLRIEKVKLPICGSEAIGSGWQWAMAAMDFGASAIEAVNYAKKRNCHTGGKIFYFNFETLGNNVDEHLSDNLILSR